VATGDFPFAESFPLVGVCDLVGVFPLVGVCNLVEDFPLAGVCDLVGEFPLAGDCDLVGDFPLAGDCDLVGDFPLAGDCDLVGVFPLAGDCDLVGVFPLAGDCDLEDFPLSDDCDFEGVCDFVGDFPVLVGEVSLCVFFKGDFSLVGVCGFVVTFCPLVEHLLDTFVGDSLFVEACSLLGDLLSIGLFSSSVVFLLVGVRPLVWESSFEEVFSFSGDLSLGLDLLFEVVLLGVFSVTDLLGASILDGICPLTVV